MRRCHAVSPGLSGHYQYLGMSSIKRYDSACNLILSVGKKHDGVPRCLCEAWVTRSGPPTRGTGPAKTRQHSHPNQCVVFGLLGCCYPARYRFATKSSIRSPRNVSRVCQWKVKGVHTSVDGIRFAGTSTNVFDLHCVLPLNLDGVKGGGRECHCVALANG